MADATVGPAAATARSSSLRGKLRDPQSSQALVFTIAGAAIGMSAAVLAMARVRGSR